MAHDPPAGSQTLARGLTALALVGESDAPLTVPELAVLLGVHRSMAYRLVRTLEKCGFVERGPGGELVVPVHRHEHRAADGEAAVTLISAEPRGAAAAVGQRPGTRHPIDRGAPGRVIRDQLDQGESPPARFQVSHHEVYEGLSSIAVPLALPGSRPMSIAAVYVTSRRVLVSEVVDRLEAAAVEIARSSG